MYPVEPSFHPDGVQFGYPDRREVACFDLPVQISHPGVQRPQGFRCQGCLRLVPDGEGRGPRGAPAARGDPPPQRTDLAASIHVGPRYHVIKPTPPADRGTMAGVDGTGKGLPLAGKCRPGGGRRPMDNRELWLAATLVELADSRDADFDETIYCGRLALHLAQLLAPAEVGVLIGDASALKAAAASTERAHRLVSFEASHGEGPDTACYSSGQPVLNESLSLADGRWPRFAVAARAAGFGIVSSLPIQRHHETVGVIVWCARRAPARRDGDQPGPDPGRGGGHRRPAAAGPPPQHPDCRPASARARHPGAHRASQRGRRRTARHHAGGGVRAAARLGSPAQPVAHRGGGPNDQRGTAGARTSSRARNRPQRPAGR